MGIKTKASTPLEDPQHRKKRIETEKILEMNLLGLYDRIEIVGDGNCMFRAIQYFLQCCQTWKKTRNSRIGIFSMAIPAWKFNF